MLSIKQFVLLASSSGLLAVNLTDARFQSHFVGENFKVKNDLHLFKVDCSTVSVHRHHFLADHNSSAEHTRHLFVPSLSVS
jgi:hypothetical protein